MIQAVELGFDIFSGSYPYVQAEKGVAFLFDWKMEENDDTEPVSAKRRKVETEQELKTTEVMIDLNDKK